MSIPVRFLTVAILLGSVAGATAAPAFAVWPSDPGVNVPLCTATNEQANTRACTDDHGGAIVVWRDRRTGTNDIYAQRVSHEGVALWGANGVPVCTAAGDQWTPVLCPDGAGGAIVAWLDDRSGGSDVYVQRINSSGAPVWTANGVALCTAPNAQSNVGICPDVGGGGAVVAWSDYRTGADANIYARRINSAGSPQWTANGVGICTMEGDQQLSSMVTDGAGGAILAWNDWRAGNRDVYARRVSLTGAAQWTVNGVAIASLALDQRDPEIVEDGAGGAILAWEDLRGGVAWDLYAQRVTAGGSILWDINGLPICTSAGEQRNPSLVPDGAGGAFAVWTDERSGEDNENVYAQRIRGEGYLQWAANGVSLCSATGNQSFPAIVADDAGGAVVAWRDHRYGQSHYFARRVSGDGVTQWAANGVALSTAGGALAESPRLVRGDEGGAIAVWACARGGASTDVYAQRVDRFGAIGEAEPVIRAVADVEADEGGCVVVRWTRSYLDADPTYDIAEYSVWREVPAVLAAARLGSAGSDPGRGRASMRTRWLGAQISYWEYFGSVPARGRAAYSLVVPTTTDSMPGSNPLTRFMVSAEEAGGIPYWDSAPFSGFSVDNLPPPMPEPFTGQYLDGVSTLQWGVSAAPDFACFRLYRGPTADFVPGPGNLIATLTTGGYADAAGGPCYYRLCAVDVHGNASPHAFLLPSGAVDVPAGELLPRELALSAPWPNPAQGSVHLRLALPRPARVSLAIHDQRGRRVRTLLSGEQPAGEQAVVWDGRDDGGCQAASGMYFGRCETEGRLLTCRITVLRR